MDVQLVLVPYRYDEHKQGVGGGPEALIDAGLLEDIAAAGHQTADAGAAFLDPADREPGRTAVNIGKLGASTAGLVGACRRSGAGCLVLAGDDTAAIGVVSGLQAAHGAGARIGIVWTDAHGDFNTPETSYSGILAGMSLAIVAGLAGPHWRDAAQMAAPISTDRIVVAGARQLDAKEEALLQVTDVHVYSTDDLREGSRFANAIGRLAEAVDLILLHVDVDVLDPRFIPSSSTPSPEGLSIEEATDALGTVLSSGKVAAFTICGINPGGGARGKRSIESSKSLLAGAIAAWREAPPAPAPGN
jgi:arginase